jgi:hypothetical protein
MRSGRGFLQHIGAGWREPIRRLYDGIPVYPARGRTRGLTVQNAGATVGARAINVIPGQGITSVMTDTGSQINMQALDSAVISTQPDTYGCSMRPTLSESLCSSSLLCASHSGSATAYTTGQTLNWIPDINGSGGATTLNVDTRSYSCCAVRRHNCSHLDLDCGGTPLSHLVRRRELQAACQQRASARGRRSVSFRQGCVTPGRRRC